MNNAEKSCHKLEEDLFLAFSPFVKHIVFFLLATYSTGDLPREIRFHGASYYVSFMFLKKIICLYFHNIYERGRRYGDYGI